MSAVIAITSKIAIIHTLLDLGCPRSRICVAFFVMVCTLNSFPLAYKIN